MGTLVGAHPLDHPGRGVRKLSEKYSNSYCFSAARILRVDTRTCDVTKDGTRRSLGWSMLDSAGVY